MGPKQCQVCNEAVSKYKCPSCLVPYCSLICFKKHKETPCSKPVSSEQNSKGVAEPPVEKTLYVYEQSDMLQRSQLEAIASCSEIRDAMKDEFLQKLICDIDCSADPQKELDKAMEVAMFQKFTDKVLSTINP